MFVSIVVFRAKYMQYFGCKKQPTECGCRSSTRQRSDRRIHRRFQGFILPLATDSTVWFKLYLIIFQESEVHAVMGEIYPEILLICVLQYVPLPTRHRTVALLFIYVRQMFWSFIFLGKFEPYGIPISGEKTKHPSLTAQQGRTEHV